MRKSDPHGLRKDAARMFVSLLEKIDRVGIVEFDREGRLLSRPVAAGEGKPREELFRTIGSIASAGLYTHIHDGIRKGFEALANSSAADKILILLSDGRLLRQISRNRRVLHCCTYCG
jgi:Mg-chelatase subunit ChlD